MYIYIYIYYECVRLHQLIPNGYQNSRQLRGFYGTVLTRRILSRSNNRRLETRVDGSEAEEDKIGLLTSALMQEEAMDSL